jgi:hypothetical protein
MPSYSSSTSSQSDALRLAVAQVYRGWYSDIDTVFMKPLTDLDGRKGTNLLLTDGKLVFFSRRRSFYFHKRWTVRQLKCCNAFYYKIHGIKRVIWKMVHETEHTKWKHNKYAQWYSNVIAQVNKVIKVPLLCLRLSFSASFVICHVISCHVLSFHFISFHVMNCNFMSFHIINCHFVSLIVILCH